MSKTHNKALHLMFGLSFACSGVAIADTLSLSSSYTETVSDSLNSAASANTSAISNAATGLSLAAEALTTAKSSYTLAEEAVTVAETGKTGTIGWTGTYDCSASYVTYHSGRISDSSTTHTTTGTYSKHFTTSSVPGSYSSVTTSAKNISGMSTSSSYGTPVCTISTIKFDED